MVIEFVTYNECMASTKAELRTSLKQARLGLSDGARTLKSREIVKRLQQAADWSNVKTLHYFEPLRELLEPDIRDFITGLEDKYPDLQLFIPRLIGDTWQLVSVRGGGPPDTFDVVIVPMLGFDSKTLHRIGYGGGYYDKFLATQPRTRKIGVCYEAGKIKNIPTEPYDIALDMIVSENHTYPS
jgi:5-formyltetrahydrofolate cyclo-ligase